jgi:hypothetical protein
MKKNRYSIPAAALLLLPLGLAGVAGPAAAQPRPAVVAQASLIERFVMRPMGRLKAGDEVRFRVNGAASGRATVDIPGVASGILLQETRPGVYEGSYTIRRTDNLDAFAQSTATLQRDGLRQVARVETRGNGRNNRDDRWDRDDRPPQISGITPAQHESVSERGRVRIGARLDDEGRSGVDRDSVRLRVDGRDVTRGARITDDEVEYRADDLRPGRHTAELTVRDRAGNEARRDWSFEVRNDVPDRRASPPPPPPPMAYVPLAVTSHGPHAVVNVDQPVVIRGRTFPDAVVRVEMKAMMLGAAPAAEQTVRADQRGHFEARMPALNTGQPSLRVDVTVTSTPPQGNPVGQQLTLRHQR